MSEYIPWIGFHVFLIIALAIDLGILHKDAHEIKFKEAIKWSIVWFSLAMIFNGGVWYFQGPERALEFLTGYLVEWSLSVDNLFVFLTLFTVFAVPAKQQHRVLFWGILGALAMRAIFIFAGITLLNKFHWLIYVFGAFLFITGVKLLFKDDAPRDPRDHWFVKWVKKHFPFTDRYHDGHFIIKENGRTLGTPLLLVLFIVEITDVIFAADSIPAILAITKDPFIVYTSNVFAILGLRSLYFALAGMMSLFMYLQYGLAVILIFVGVKLGISNFYKIPSTVSLFVILTCLGLAVFASAVKTRLDQKNGKTK
jgi:tellurite resistance protein TerC